jgi:Spy/CpxP family protein refolding chaperone
MGGMQAGREGMMRCSMMQGGMGHDSAMGEAMEGLMAGMAGAAEHVLAAKATLHLTGDQEGRISAFRDVARTAHEAAMQDARHHGQELAEVMRAAAPDTSALKAHFNGTLAAMGQAHLAMLRSAALTRAVLTDAQRHQVDSLQIAMGCGMMGGSGAQPAHAH